MKICLIRLDKIGDLVSTLPVDQIPELAGHQVKWVINEGLGFLPKRADPPREFIEIPLNQKSIAQKKLSAFLADYKPDLAVVFYAPWWVGLELWRGHVARRFGRLSQWHSFIFFNEGLRQKRSLSEFHEADYNLALLLAALTGEDGTEEIKKGRTPPLLNLTSAPLRHLFEKYELKSQNYYVVHPGMAGSALNWPTEHYVKLIQQLKEEKEVVITGTATDEKWIKPLRQIFEKDPRVQILQGLLSIEELLFILKNAAAVVAPSTGVLHLAAALGTPSVGIYSPVLAHHPKRWGPRGHRAQALVPEMTGAKDENPMPRLTPEQVLTCLQSL